MLLLVTLRYLSRSNIQLTEASHCLLQHSLDS